MIKDAGASSCVLGYKHIGMYAYTKSFLLQFPKLKASRLEDLEKLEQLRALHLGGRMKVVKATSRGPGVDHPDDVPRAERALREAGLIA